MRRLPGVASNYGGKEAKNPPDGIWRSGLRRKPGFHEGASTNSYYFLELAAEL